MYRDDPRILFTLITIVWGEIEDTDLDQLTSYTWLYKKKKVNNIFVGIECNSRQARGILKGEDSFSRFGRFK